MEPTWANMSRYADPLRIGDACDYVGQAALGLQHAHERNLVHRDIKPVNLFLTHALVPVMASGTKAKKISKPLIKILDWGLAGLHYPKGQSSSELMQSMAKGIVGTADYLSPEQARNHLTVDIRGDIYSLGCTFYFLLTGQPPFPTGTLMQKILQHQQAEPEAIGAFREDVPADLIGVLKRMLAKDPNHRFQTPAAVALAFAPFIRENPASLDAVCRKLGSIKKGGGERGKDNTPMPDALGFQGRIAKAGRHRNPGHEADTSCPRA